MVILSFDVFPCRFFIEFQITPMIYVKEFIQHVISSRFISFPSNTNNIKGVHRIFLSITLLGNKTSNLVISIKHDCLWFSCVPSGLGNLLTSKGPHYLVYNSYFRKTIKNASGISKIQIGPLSEYIEYHNNEGRTVIIYQDTRDWSCWASLSLLQPCANNEGNVAQSHSDMEMF